MLIIETDFDFCRLQRFYNKIRYSYIIIIKKIRKYLS